MIFHCSPVHFDDKTRKQLNPMKFDFYWDFCRKKVVINFNYIFALKLSRDLGNKGISEENISARRINTHDRKRKLHESSRVDIIN
eukprot:snap_masked-scaffold_18-processed-gene-0.19-mRNA-1 protein AED:1.00 eAED:1.00 QI:0/-1/0/0/-1/1/1/0/84